MFLVGPCFTTACTVRNMFCRDRLDVGETACLQTTSSHLLCELAFRHRGIDLTVARATVACLRRFNIRGD